MWNKVKHHYRQTDKIRSNTGSFCASGPDLGAGIVLCDGTPQRNDVIPQGINRRRTEANPFSDICLMGEER
jgi:hypothetical protein